MKTYSINTSLHTQNDYEKYINKTIQTKTSGKAKILGVHDKIKKNKRYIVEFLDTGFQTLVYRGSIIDKKIKDDTLPNPFVGNIYSSNNYGDLIVVAPEGGGRYLCEFISTKTQTVAYLDNIKKGEVADPYAPTIYGVACTGKVEPKDHTYEYIRWSKLIERLYSPDRERKFPNYLETTMDEKWLCFENFTRDFKEIVGYKEAMLHPEIPFDLDKDIKTLQNHYSKDTCVIVPHEINTIINFIQKTNTTGYPGVSWDIEKGRYQVGMTKKNNRVHLGYSETLKDGFSLFANEKREYLYELLSCEYCWLDINIKKMIVNRLEERLSRYEL